MEQGLHDRGRAVPSQQMRTHCRVEERQRAGRLLGCRLCTGRIRKVDETWRTSSSHGFVEPRSADDELIGSTVTTKKLGFNDGESSVDSRTSGSNETSSIDHIECIEVRDEVDEYLDSSNPDQLGEQRAL